jgi:hypothetical protein
VAITLTCASWSAVADEKEQAKQLFDAGLKLMRMDDFGGATADFERSVALYPTQNSLFNLANCYKAVRRYTDALDVLARLRRQFGDKLKPEVKEAADRQEQEIQSLVGRLTIQTVPADAKVKLDGRELGTGPALGPIVLGPGDHAIEATRPGYQDLRRSVQLVSGTEVTEVFNLVAEPGQVALLTNADGASVLADGKKVGTTPLASYPAQAPGYPPPVAAPAPGYLPGYEAPPADTSPWYRSGYAHLGGILGFHGWGSAKIEGTDLPVNGGFWGGVSVSGYYVTSPTVHIGGYFYYGSGKMGWRDNRYTDQYSVGLSLKVGTMVAGRVWLGLVGDLGFCILGSSDNMEGNWYGVEISPRIHLDVLARDDDGFKMGFFASFGPSVVPYVAGSGTETVSIPPNGFPPYSYSYDMGGHAYFIYLTMQLGLTFGG